MGKVPVSFEIKPQGSINVENLRASNLVSSVHTVGARVPSPRPAEHHDILTLSPPQKHPPGRHFLASSPGMDFPPTTFSTPPMSPESRFLEKHNIMKWVIDDQDEGDIPGLSAGISCPTESQLTAPVTSQPTPGQLEEEDNDGEPSQGPRKRGRPLKESPSANPYKKERIQFNVSTVSTSGSEFSHLSDSTDQTDDEVSALKYRRMRDLNNEASRRCRDRRRVNQENKERELEQHRHRNLVLRNECDILETKVRQIKNYILKSFKNPQQEI